MGLRGTEIVPLYDSPGWLRIAAHPALAAGIAILLLVQPIAVSPRPSVHAPHGGLTAMRFVDNTGSPTVRAQVSEVTSAASGTSESSPGWYALNQTTTPAWTNISGQTIAPPSRVGAGLVFDPVDGYDLLFGGEGPTAPMNDSWIFSQGVWSEIYPNQSPPARDHFSMVWDPSGPFVLLFGGAASPNVTFSDTWTFLHGKWNYVPFTIHPIARWGSSMTWDGRDQEIVLFGGCAASNPLNDTWEFSSGLWREDRTGSSPPAREDAELGYDGVSNQTILFGGDDYSNQIFGDTWSFAGGVWHELGSVGSPGNLTYGSMAYDTGIRAFVLYGGYDGTAEGRTWSFDGERWLPLAVQSGPSPRFLSILAPYGNSTLLLFSGDGSSGFLSDTWELYDLQLTPYVAATGSGTGSYLFAVAVTGGVGGVTVNWMLGDGTLSNLASFSHTFLHDGSYLGVAEANDTLGARSIVELVFAVTTAGPSASESSTNLLWATFGASFLAGGLFTATLAILMRRRVPPQLAA